MSPLHLLVFEGEVHQSSLPFECTFTAVPVLVTRDSSGSQESMGPSVSGWELVAFLCFFFSFEGFFHIKFKCNT